MIQVTSHMRVVAVEPADFRCGIDGLARVCKTDAKMEPPVHPSVPQVPPRQRCRRPTTGGNADGHNRNPKKEIAPHVVRIGHALRTVRDRRLELAPQRL